MAGSADPASDAQATRCRLRRHSRTRTHRFVT
jgi:hypothetical protein